jgi:hypothetical protein
MRLDELSARKIALGRLKLIKEDIITRAEIDPGEPRVKPKARQQQLIGYLRQMYGESLLWTYAKGRIIEYVCAAPDKSNPRHVAVTVTRANLRSGARRIYRVLDITEHALARLVERSGDVELLTRLRSELQPTCELNIRAMFYGAEPPTMWPTATGEFRLQYFDATPTATTWIRNTSA